MDAIPAADNIRKPTDAEFNLWAIKFSAKFIAYINDHVKGDKNNYDFIFTVTKYDIFCNIMTGKDIVADDNANMLYLPKYDCYIGELTRLLAAKGYITKPNRSSIYTEIFLTFSCNSHLK